jgi:hypothetical protein
MTRASEDQTPERRAPNVSRVALSTLVEICGQNGVVPAFEGESRNVSGHGMQVRTSYLPEIGDGLVCRFEHQGQEVLVEGRVAWRAEGEDGGEFGIQFTALDAASVDVLGSLNGAKPAAANEAEEEGDEDAPLRAGAEPGSRVRLHIDGLGAPMKARVHDGNPRKVRVGSNLEFLKVGRTLEIEDVQAGLRQGAHVDSVSVAMNPSTKVPELVVVLRYEGAESTPAPSVVDSLGEVEEARPSRAAASKLRAPELDAADEGDDADDEESFDGGGLMRGAETLRKRLEGVARGASQAASVAQGVLGRVGGGLAEGASKIAQGASAQMKRAGTASNDPKRRTAAPPVSARSSVSALRGTARTDSPSLRPQRPTQPRSTGSDRAPAPAAVSSKRRLTALAAGALVLVVGSAFALRGGKSEDATPALSQAVPQSAPQAAAPATGAAPVAVPNGAAPAALASAAPAQALAAAPTPGGIVADVPLFGPKAMATSEPAPLATAPDTATAERLAAAAATPDEAWEEDAPKETATDVKPWGRGKLHLPTIHRVRLDGAGKQLAGAIESTGFTIVVPGRKAMESGRNIEKRDKRIAQVKASNTDRGASITFKFRGKVPAYRVRLSKDFVEFLISAPEGEGAQL